MNLASAALQVLLVVGFGMVVGSLVYRLVQLLFFESRPRRWSTGSTVARTGPA